MRDITFYNKDIASKITAESLVGKTLASFGLPDLKVIRLLPTNLPAIESNELRLDNLFELEDGSVAIVDYESVFTKTNFVKYLNYIARVLRRYSNDKRLDNKIYTKETLTEEELAQLMILPLTVKGKKQEYIQLPLRQ